MGVAFLRMKGDGTLKKCLRYFTPPEWGLWLGSVLAIGGAYRAFDRGGFIRWRQMARSQAG